VAGNPFPFYFLHKGGGRREGVGAPPPFYQKGEENDGPPPWLEKTLPPESEKEGFFVPAQSAGHVRQTPPLFHLSFPSPPSLILL